MNNSVKIDEEIIKHLKTSDLVIVDLTFLNPNVFFEIGYRSALGKPIIHIVKEGTEVPFDIRQFRYLKYSTEGFGTEKQIKDSLIQSINSINFDNPINNKNKEKTSSWELGQITNNLFDEILSIKNISEKIYFELTKSNLHNNLNLSNNTTKVTDKDILTILLDKGLEDPKKLMQLIEVMDKLNKS